MELYTVTIKIPITIPEEIPMEQLSKDYISLVNKIANDALLLEEFSRLTSATVSSYLPSVLRGQAIQDARSLFQRYKGTGFLPNLKKPVYHVNNQSYYLCKDYLQFVIPFKGSTKQIRCSLHLSEKQLADLYASKKIGMLRVVQKNNRWYAYIPIYLVPNPKFGEGEMGIDLGIRAPAVAVTNKLKTKFFGNGRQIKYIRRKHNSFRRKMGKLKKVSAIRKRSNKEGRWITDQNHKISRGIINFAVKHNIGTIKLEWLMGIRRTTSTGRKTKNEVHSWSFFQLQSYIAYKARALGIRVEGVDPAYTSQTCPLCKARNKAIGRLYKCPCGFLMHRDRVGAINILMKPITDGVRKKDSQLAH